MNLPLLFRLLLSMGSLMLKNQHHKNVFTKVKLSDLLSLLKKEGIGC